MEGLSDLEEQKWEVVEKLRNEKIVLLMVIGGWLQPETNYHCTKGINR